MFSFKKMFNKIKIKLFFYYIISTEVIKNFYLLYYFLESYNEISNNS